MNAVKKIEIKSVFNDIAKVDADVIALKFAREFYGADSAIAMTLSDSVNQLARLSPEIGQFSLVSTEGKIEAKKALFVGVPELLSFRYTQIYEFSKKVLEILKNEDPSVQILAMTIHGVGYGLDETESIISQIHSLVDSLKEGQFPQDLECILIAEKNKSRAKRFKI